MVNGHAEAGFVKRLVDIDELSVYLSLPKSTIYTWVCTHKIPPECIVKFGRALRFEVIEIDKWVNQHKEVKNGKY